MDLLDQGPVACVACGRGELTSEYSNSVNWVKVRVRLSRRRARV